MSIVKALFDQSVISTDECFGQPDVTSQEMRDAINAWRDTYLKREGDKASDPCMRMAYVIVHKLQKGVFAEYSSDILDKEKRPRENGWTGTCRSSTSSGTASCSGC